MALACGDILLLQYDLAFSSFDKMIVVKRVSKHLESCYSEFASPLEICYFEFPSPLEICSHYLAVLI